jgi:hypothetical protein
MFEMDDVQDFTVERVNGLDNQHLETVGRENF